jgi:CBS domain-containing protein
MAETIAEVMMPRPLTVDSAATIPVAAQLMRDSDIGDVLVVDDGRLRGILTDRDIVVRAVAAGGDIRETAVGDCCSGDVQTVGPREDMDHAVRVMREHALRRLPVVEDGQLVGIVSIGDLAVERDPGSALADISAAAPNS